MKVHSYRCDYCSSLKGESNHWWLRAPDREKFTLRCWDDVQADVPGCEHICSESCAAKGLSKWMTRLETHPEPQVLAPSDIRVPPKNSNGRRESKIDDPHEEFGQPS